MRDAGGSIRPGRRRLALGLALGLIAVSATGCVRRTLRITSEPDGALVWLNDREIGRTPVDVDFVHYGTYDVRLVKDGYESLLTNGDAKPPLWDNIGLDLVAEVLPMEFKSEIEWHYVLEPVLADAEALRAATVDRARELRAEMEGETAPAPAAGPDPPSGGS